MLGRGKWNFYDISRAQCKRPCISCVNCINGKGIQARNPIFTLPTVSVYLIHLKMGKEMVVNISATAGANYVIRTTPGSSRSTLLKVPALPPCRPAVELRLPDRLRYDVDDVGLILDLPPRVVPSSKLDPGPFEVHSKG